jgi:hypothetical protein
MLHPSCHRPAELFAIDPCQRPEPIGSCRAHQTGNKICHKHLISAKSRCRSP